MTYIDYRIKKFIEKEACFHEKIKPQKVDNFEVLRSLYGFELISKNHNSILSMHYTEGIFYISSSNDLFLKELNYKKAIILKFLNNRIEFKVKKALDIKGEFKKVHSEIFKAYKKPTERAIFKN